MPLLTDDEAERLGAEFRPLFSSTEAFEVSVKTCFEKLKTPSLERARRWLEEDLVADRRMARVIGSAEPLLPVRQSFELSDCRHCGGKRWLRREDLEVGHPDFGRLIPCQFCSGTHEKSACEICRKPSSFSGYLGPETATVPADWEPGKSVPMDWQPVHGGHR